MPKQIDQNRGFTLTETLIVISILALIALFLPPVFNNWSNIAGLDGAVMDLKENIRLAQSRSAAGEYDLPGGIYFIADENGADKYILYKGESYQARDGSYDRKFILMDSLEISSSFADNDLHFIKYAMEPSQAGVIAITDKTGNSTRTIAINEYGVIFEN